MKKLIPIAVILSFAVWSGCGDDEPDTPTGSNGPTVVRVVANTMVSAPTLSSVDEAVWSSVTEYAIDVSSNFSPKLPAPASSAASDSVHVKAIVSGGELYLRVEFDDNDLNVLKDYYKTEDDNLNFERVTSSQEDQVFVIYSGLPNGNFDVWNWRSLTTGTAGLAEGLTLINNTLVVDSGPQQVAFINEDSVIVGRPKWVHTTGASYTGEILYIEDLDTMANHLNEFFAAGLVVQGWYVDSGVGNQVQNTFPQSRWDIFTVSSFGAVNERITVVLKRKLNTTYSEDLVLVDSVQVRIGIFDNQSDFDLQHSRRGFTELFWLIL